MAESATRPDACRKPVLKSARKNSVRLMINGEGRIFWASLAFWLAVYIWILALCQEPTFRLLVQQHLSPAPIHPGGTQGCTENIAPQDLPSQK